MNGSVFGNQERATLSPKMALTIESRETGGVLELSWRNDPNKSLIGTSAEVTKPPAARLFGKFKNVAGR